MQASSACGSRESHAPASRSRLRPSCRPGSTITMAEMLLVRTIDAPAEAAASSDCCVLHHGGNRTATALEFCRGLNVSVAIITKLNASKLPLASHARVIDSEESGRCPIRRKVNEQG